METISVNGLEYETVRLLGKGTGGYSYLVKKGAEEYVLKQIHHEPCSYYQFGDKLQSELREMQMHKSGSAASALEQQKLEKRIMLLRTEYYEMTDCIREIGLYAEKEAQ